MRIAYVCADPGIPVFGTKGASVHVQEVIRALRRAGALVELFACRWGDDAPADMQDMPLHRLPALPKGDCATRERAALQANEALTGALQQAGPFDAVYERYALWSHAGMDYAAHHRIAGLLEVNAPLIPEQKKYRELVDSAGAQRVAERVFTQASQILAVSEPVADYVAGYVAGVAADRERIQVIPNGVDTQRFSPCPADNEPSEKAVFTLGFIGTLKPWHGLPLLVEAFARLHEQAPESRLLIVGDGPKRESLQQRVAELDLSNQVTFTGAVSPRHVPQWLAKMDAAVAPYPDQPDSYFSPLKLFEYLAMGLPVVASRVGQVADIIEHKVNGLLYPAENLDQLTEMLVALCKQPELRRRLGAAARHTAVTSHTWDAVAQRILSMVEAQRTDKPRATASADYISPGGDV